MAYKVHNPYKEAQIMELNFMGINEHRKISFSAGEILLTITPLVLAGIAVATSFLPELSFMAECVNIGATGDVCHIAMQ
ncbi:MAG: hypothetical protein LRZ85_01950 [Alphaproteobacteria bacterium]|nr:hypothetical protein [Alphaproteobacteria bacterium]MCD8525726.1 hypothetical protein [Alphaproteobacteria bacterium]MCD8570990.1 hypothetical protein [Alphaproteobacteria bacterium]